MKDHFIPFTIALIVFGLVFLALDFSIMKLQGLTLIFHGYFGKTSQGSFTNDKNQCPGIIAGPGVISGAPPASVHEQ
jgi:hypothetical protein